MSGERELGKARSPRDPERHKDPSPGTPFRAPGPGEPVPPSPWVREGGIPWPPFPGLSVRCQRSHMLLMTEARGGEAGRRSGATGVPPSATRLLQRLEEEEEDGVCQPDTCSIVTDDSFYPPDLLSLSGEAVSAAAGPLSLYRACATNNAAGLKEMVRRELSEREVMENDRNGRTGLMVACYQGFMDIVFIMAQCPHLDVNWQDKEGNTALIIAAQAGHTTITNYLLNYFPGLDVERRNVHGFTALMKAGMQGRTDCVRALMLAGADINATDPGRGFTPRQWAQFTGRYETIFLMHKLLARPCPVQFSDKYKPEWPKLKELVAKANEPSNCLEKICETIRSALSISFPRDPEEDGPLDHMVRMTTAISSPFVATGCRTVCPSSPPCVGKRRFMVQEILRRQESQEVTAQDKNCVKYQKLFQTSQLAVVPKRMARSASLQPVRSPSTQLTVASSRRGGLVPLSLLRLSSVQPGVVVPKVRVLKAPTLTYDPERVRRKSSAKSSNFLELPMWRYKELKEERKKAEEEKRRAEEAERKRAERKMTADKESLIVNPATIQGDGEQKKDHDTTLDCGMFLLMVATILLVYIGTQKTSSLNLLSLSHRALFCIGLIGWKK